MYAALHDGPNSRVRPVAGKYKGAAKGESDEDEVVLQLISRSSNLCFKKLTFMTRTIPGVWFDCVDGNTRTSCKVRMMKFV